MIYDTLIRRRKEEDNMIIEGDMRELRADEAMKDPNVEDVVSVRVLLETLVSGGFECGKVKPKFHPFRGQQVDLANLPTLIFNDEEVLDIVFPPTGFDFLTTRYGNTTAFNTAAGYLIRDKPAHVVNFVQHYNVLAVESVVFKVVTDESTYFLRWCPQYIEWLLEEAELGYYRLEGETWINYSKTEGENCAVAMTMSSNIPQDLLVNVDGVSMAVPRCSMSVYEVKNKFFLDSIGSVYGRSVAVDGVYLCNNDDMSIISSWYGKPDSPQQIQLMKEKIWTVGAMLREWNFPAVSQVVNLTKVYYFDDWLDSLDRGMFQLKKNVHRLAEAGSRQDLVHKYMVDQTYYSEYWLNCFIAHNAVVKKNILYMPYRNLDAEGQIRYNGQVYSRLRTTSSRIYVKKRVRGIGVGWWYQVIK